ncbi:hypothetical protein MAR_000785 [Mya arenaria]|uniref:Uncharacterized protein n=1 Tax=Mya arenaria TaxID=6604 RepID=A0ABY7FBG2_MYAAR|nr:hypothetical protein MAR_000785 [Mya arenaria]
MFLGVYSDGTWVGLSKKGRSHSSSCLSFMPFYQSDPTNFLILSIIVCFIILDCTPPCIPMGLNEGAFFSLDTLCVQEIDESWPEDDIRAAARNVMTGKEPPCPPLSAAEAHCESAFRRLREKATT